MICKCGYKNTPEGENRCLMCGEALVKRSKKTTKTYVIGVENLRTESLYGTIELKGSNVVITIPKGNIISAKREINLIKANSKLPSKFRGKIRDIKFGVERETKRYENEQANS